MVEVSAFRPPNRIGEVLVSARSLGEYRAMFALTEAELAGRILDCPGGAASFTAEVPSAIACDPAYVLPAGEIVARTRADLARGYRYHQANPDEYVWTYFSDPDHYLAVRSRSIERFGAHIAARPGRYVAAGLPSLPFPDAAFDLALCSHLLFSYADRLDQEFHLASILELTRVAAEVRIFPLVAMGLADNPTLPALRAELERRRVRTTVRPVAYEFQRGGHSMLSCHLNG